MCCFISLCIWRCSRAGVCRRLRIAVVAAEPLANDFVVVGVEKCVEHWVQTHVDEAQVEHDVIENRSQGQIQGRDVEVEEKEEELVWEPTAEEHCQHHKTRRCDLLLLLPS